VSSQLDDRAKSTGKRIVREDGLEYLEYIEEEDSPEAKFAKRLQGVTKPPGLRVFNNGRELERDTEHSEKK